MLASADSSLSVPFDTSSRFADAEPFANTPQMDELSQPLIGQWNTLVSQTNWEKGEI